jgi:hypothetical protein
MPKHHEDNLNDCNHMKFKYNEFLNYLRLNLERGIFLTSIILYINICFIILIYLKVTLIKIKYHENRENNYCQFEM